VELLIVIVVIAILATISIIAYRGVQERSRNSQTISAVTAYIKALRMYKVDNDQYPPATSCLGTGYTSGRCHSGGSYIENGGNFNSTHMADYFNSGFPTPALNAGQYDATTQLTGAWYAWNNGLYGGANNGGIGLYHQGGGSCPAIGGMTFRTSTPFTDGSGLWCRYSLDG
jgi:type II secretory pathway pseudopilin PulG